MFVTAWHITKAIDGIQGASPLAIVTIPALAQTAGGTGQAIKGTPFGSTEETAFLDRYFKVSGAPDAQKPYRAIWEADKWVNNLYPGRSLQRQRTDRARRGVCLHQKPGPSRQDIWAVLPNAAADIELRKPIRSIDLAIWLGRDQEVDSLPELLGWFQSTFNIRADSNWDLVPSLYDETIPPDYLKQDLQPDCLDNYAISELVGGLGSPGAGIESLDPIETAIQLEMDGAKFFPPHGLIRRVLNAWIRGDLVVLVGQPGTGKTKFTSLLTQAFCACLGLEPPLLVPVNSNYDETDFLGYESLAGDEVLRKFTLNVLQAPNALEPHVVVLEEFNLGVVEQYLASVLTAMEEPSRRVSLPRSEAYLPEDTFLIATCNSYLDEATRNRLSYATKRRCAVFEMPNVLAVQLDSDSTSIPRLVVAQIEQAKSEAVNRVSRGRGTSFDQYRIARWTTIRSPKDLSDEVKLRLEILIKGLLGTPEGASFMTFGLLRDIALEIGLADRNSDAELDGFLSAVDSKIIPQLRGEHSNAQPVLAAVGGIPGAGLLENRIERLKDLDPDQIVTLL